MVGIRIAINLLTYLYHQTDNDCDDLPTDLQTDPEIPPNLEAADVLSPEPVQLPGREPSPNAEIEPEEMSVPETLPTPEPEVIPEPETFPEPEALATPELEVECEALPTPETEVLATHEPEPEVIQEPETLPEASATPEPEFEALPTPEPEVLPKSEIVEPAIDYTPVRSVRDSLTEIEAIQRPASVSPVPYVPVESGRDSVASHVTESGMESSAQFTDGTVINPSETKDDVSSSDNNAERTLSVQSGKIINRDDKTLDGHSMVDDENSIKCSIVEDELQDVINSHRLSLAMMEQEVSTVSSLQTFFGFGTIFAVLWHSRLASFYSSS